MIEEIMNKDFDGFWHMFFNEGGEDEIADRRNYDDLPTIDAIGRQVWCS